MSEFKAFEGAAMTLHILQTRQSLQRALPAIAGEDHLLLLADACYLALSDGLSMAKNVYALSDDAVLRGIQLPDEVIGIDMIEFVELSALHIHSVSW